MIRTAQWKYFFYTNGDEYLYDLQADPSEDRNLVASPEHRKLVDELKRKASEGWIPAPPPSAKQTAKEKKQNPGGQQKKK
jgi:arylsulfatase A-like enzyme